MRPLHGTVYLAVLCAAALFLHSCLKSLDEDRIGSDPGDASVGGNAGSAGNGGASGAGTGGQAGSDAGGGAGYLPHDPSRHPITNLVHAKSPVSFYVESESIYYTEHGTLSGLLKEISPGKAPTILSSVDTPVRIAGRLGLGDLLHHQRIHPRPHLARLQGRSQAVHHQAIYRGSVGGAELPSQPRALATHRYKLRKAESLLLCVSK